MGFPAHGRGTPRRRPVLGPNQQERSDILAVKQKIASLLLIGRSSGQRPGNTGTTGWKHRDTKSAASVTHLLCLPLRQTN